MDREQGYEQLHDQLTEEYPGLVRVLGEFGARTELEVQLAQLVTQSILDPTDADELGTRIIYGTQ